LQHCAQIVNMCQETAMWVSSTVLPLNPSYKSATNAISPSQRPTLGKAWDLFSVTLDLVFGFESLCSLWCTELWGYYMVAESRA